MKTPLLFLGLTVLLASCQAAKPPAPAPPEIPVTLHHFKLTGELHDNRAAFTLSAIAKVESSKGGSLDLFAGTVALTELDPKAKWRVRAEENRYVAVFDHSGEFPIQLKFSAAVRASNGWNTVEFRVA